MGGGKLALSTFTVKGQQCKFEPSRFRLLVASYPLREQEFRSPHGPARTVLIEIADLPAGLWVLPGCSGYTLFRLLDTNMMLSPHRGREATLAQFQKLTTCSAPRARRSCRAAEFQEASSWDTKSL